MSLIDALYVRAGYIYTTNVHAHVAGLKEPMAKLTREVCRCKCDTISCDSAMPEVIARQERTVKRRILKLWTQKLSASSSIVFQEPPSWQLTALKPDTRQVRRRLS